MLILTIVYVNCLHLNIGQLFFPHQSSSGSKKSSRSSSKSRKQENDYDKTRSTLSKASNALSLHQSSEANSSKNFKVVIRVRPPLPRELNRSRNFQNIVEVDRGCRQITLSENLDPAVKLFAHFECRNDIIL